MADKRVSADASFLFDSSSKKLTDDPAFFFPPPASPPAGLSPDAAVMNYKLVL